MPMKAVAAESRRRRTPSTWEMERINWMEFREWIPAKINTVLLPLGTIEPHGVTANGADILAPVAMARAIASRVNAMIAPVVPYGFTGISHIGLYGGAFGWSVGWRAVDWSAGTEKRIISGLFLRADGIDDRNGRLRRSQIICCGRADVVVRRRDGFFPLSFVFRSGPGAFHSAVVRLHGSDVSFHDGLRAGER
ncbi:MAG: hypothetical protein DMF17_12860 [Verrucomicrobia bacterium]|nr:MAG: hypothetical protein DMF17_12860 [Verrucomicrobiota bacterium]